jgi:tetratricopeptide (TPR) repeat protein
MRRVALIAVIAAILGVMALGIYWYLHRNTAQKLLIRSELALRAKEYDRALQLAESVIAKDPGDWRGYHARGKALACKGMYDEAREALEEAAKHDPPGVEVELAVAETYAMPGRRTLASQEPAIQPSVILEAVGHLRRANEYLALVKAKDEASSLDVQEATAFNVAQIGGAQRALSSRLKKEAQRAQLAGQVAEKEANEKAAKSAEAESEQSQREAAKALMAVVKRDPKRAAAAKLLVELYAWLKDRQALEEIRQVMEAQQDPPVAAAVGLIREELAAGGETDDAGKVSKSRQDAAQKLDRILEKHPDSVEAKIARAEVALLQAEPEKVIALCSQVSDAKPSQDQQAVASLLSARALMMENKWEEAERVLHTLKTGLPNWAVGQYYYALAADGAGKKQVAREAMRRVTEIERQSSGPDPAYAAAHRFLAESLLGSGIWQEAFPEAKAYYDAMIADQSEAGVAGLPVALGLYIRAAKQTDQTGLARTALEAAVKSHPSRPEVLLAVCDGYARLGEQASAARKPLEMAVECSPKTVAGRLAVARALALLGRVSESEKLLTELGATRQPEDARVPFELGRLYVLTGRRLQAIEQFRVAVRLDNRNTLYHEALVGVLYEAGLYDECLTECQAILDHDPTNAAAVRLTNLIRLAEGEDLLPQPGAEALSGLALAQAYLANGHPQRCVDACLEHLRKAANDVDAQLLLGQAYLALGQNDKCIEQWTAALKQAPAQLPIYLHLAAVMSRSAKPEEVEARLASIPGARRDLVDLAVGWLFDRRGQYDAAAEAYGRLASRQDAPEDARNLARLRRVRSLARAGHADQAIAEVDQLASTQAVRPLALYYKATLLASTNRSKEADAILVEMAQQAIKDRDATMLERIALLHVQMRQTDKAMAVCEDLQKLLPNDARPCLARAQVMAAAGRTEEAIGWYRKAIERQPGNLRPYIVLARALDATNRPLDAMAVLKQLAGMGQTARSEALFEEGAMLARWGLQAQAAATFEQLAEAGRGGDPQVQLAMGRAFTVLGKKDLARQTLEKVPEYAPQYVTARQILADLEDTRDQKLAVLTQLRKAKQDPPAVVAQEIAILCQANRPDDAVKLFQGFDAKRGQGTPLPGDLCAQAFRAMLMANDVAGAAGLAARLADESREPMRRQLAALLASDVKPEAARAWLPEVGAATPNEAILGLVIAAKTGQPVLPWKNRLDEIQKILSQRTPLQSLPGNLRFLSALAVDAKAEAQAALPKAVGAAGTGRQMAEELFASSSRNPKAAEEAVGLLQASLATELGVPSVAHAWAMRLLKARPTCQWAAAVAAQTAPDAATLREVLRLLQPRDCLLAQVTNAQLATAMKENDKAIDFWKSAVQAEKDSPELVMRLAMAFEQAGRLADALPLYQQVWESTHSPLAGNNVAYITAQLYPKDAARLAEARKCIEAVVKAQPNVAETLDTSGWIALLQGRNEEAVSELRRAVKGRPDSPAVHCHLGQAEAAVGQTEMARWHFAAAVSLADKLKAEGTALDAGAAEAARLAREALDKMGPPKS